MSKSVHIKKEEHGDEEQIKKSFLKIFNHKNRSISKELAISLILLIILFEGVMLGYLYHRQSRFLLQELNKKADDYSVNLSEVLVVPIWDYDDEQISKIGEGFVQNEVIDEIRIMDSNGKTLFQSNDKPSATNRIERSVDIRYKGQVIGLARLFFSLDAYKKDLVWFRNAVFLIFGGSLFVIFITTGILLRVFMRKPLDILYKGIGRVAKGDYSYAFEEVHYRELFEIANRFSEMASEIQIRESSLQAVNRELQQEIEERKRAEEALQESEKKYRTVLETSLDPIVVYDMQGKVTYFNPAFTRIFGWRLEECIGKKMDLFVPDDTWPETRRMIEKVMAGESFSGFETLRYTKDKNIIHVSMSAAIYKDKTGKPKGSVINLRDITEQKKLESQLRQSHKMESIGTLAGGIAHDFNNILGIIVGNTELAIDDVPEWNPTRHNLEEIRTASLRARDVVRQLLSFARKTKLEKKPTNIIPIVEESLKLLRSSIPTSIEIRQNFSEDIDTILADPTQINQVLINLCTNADHAMPDGGILEVNLKNIELDKKIAAEYSEEPGGYVNLTVADTGHGISQRDIERIFDPYFTTKEVGRGTGMGLAVVHSIVKEHKGIINVESELGKGTTFSIFFPVVEKKVAQEIETNEKLPTGDERILFIDDEESIVKLGRQSLERLGYKVEAMTSPIEALSLFHSQPDKFDLVITDLTMPKMTGDKLVKEILNIRQDIPIILCTGFSQKIDEKIAKEIGAKDYAEKPLDKRNFAFKVRKVIDGIR